MPIPQTLVVLLLFACSPVSAAQTIWGGPGLTFSKPTGVSDPVPQQYWDEITPGVILTRNNLGGFHNAAVEDSHPRGSDRPTGTMWALGTTADLGSLTFDTFVGVVGPGGLSIGFLQPNEFPIDMVLHLTNEDIYLDFSLEAWGVGGAGNYAYTRSTPSNIPEPGALVLAGIAGLVALRWRR